MKHITAILVGAVVVYITMVLLAGPDTANSILVLSIVCTAGISLVLWLPLCLVVGLASLALARAAVDLTRRAPASSGAESVPVPDGPVDANRDYDVAIIARYVQKATAANVPRGVIIDRLQRQGWSEREIAQGLNAAGSV